MTVHPSKPVPSPAVHTSLPLPSSIRQIDGLQILRAVAVLLVAWLHAGQDLFVVSQKFIPDLGICGIDIFFVISGFILASVVMRSTHRRGGEAAWYFLKRRLIRIFPIYWIFTAVTFLRMWHAHNLDRRYLPSILLLPGSHYPEWWIVVAVGWTLVFEMFFYYVLAAIQLVTVKRAVPLLIAVLSLSVALGTVYSIRRPYLIVIGNPILLEFVFGACLALVFRKFGRRRLLGIGLTVGSVVGAFVVKLFYDTGAMSMQMILMDEMVFKRVFTWGLVAAALTAGIVFWSPSPKGPIGKVSVVLGNASYSAYLASPLVIEYSLRAVTASLRRYVPFSNAIHLLCQTAVVIAVLLAGWLCYQFIEWPLLRRLQALFLNAR